MYTFTKLHDRCIPNVGVGVRVRVGVGPVEFQLIPAEALQCDLLPDLSSGGGREARRHAPRAACAGWNPPPSACTRTWPVVQDVVESAIALAPCTAGARLAGWLVSFQAMSVAAA